MRRRLLFVILAVLLLAPFFDGRPRLALFGNAPTLTVSALPKPARLTSGRLTWLAGVRLDSDDPAFGGWSALRVVPGSDGQRFQLLNDGGNLASFSLDERWRVGDARFGALPAGPRTGWEKRDRDSESLATGPDGRLWVGFESANEVWRYSPGFSQPAVGARPRAVRKWLGNGGMEALARLRDGRFVTIAESSRRPGQKGLAGFVFAGDPVAAPDHGFAFSYLPASGFEVSDAAALPGGDLLVLERRWLLPVRFRSRIALVRAAALRPGAEVRGIELGRIEAPWPTANYEGIAVTREGDAMIVWLLSDNDQDWWRPSYLIKLRIG